MQSHFLLLSTARAEGQIRHSKLLKGSVRNTTPGPLCSRQVAKCPTEHLRDCEGWLLLKEQGRKAERSNKTKE